MSESFWYVVEMVGFILAGSMFILNIILFIRMKIPFLIGELSGKRFEKEVKQIRASYVDYDMRSRIRRKGAERRETVTQNPINRMNQSDWRAETDRDFDTEVLKADSEDTLILSEQTELLENQETTSVLQTDSQFELVKELLIVHTKERVSQTIMQEL